MSAFLHVQMGEETMTHSLLCNPSAMGGVCCRGAVDVALHVCAAPTEQRCSVSLYAGLPGCCAPQACIRLSLEHGPVGHTAAVLSGEMLYTVHQMGDGGMKCPCFPLGKYG